MFIGIAQTPLEVGEKAPSFSLASSAGKEISLEDYEGRKVFLFFFRGTWCPQCKNHMRAIHRELADLQNHGVSILGICCQGIEPVSAFMAKEGLAFPLLADTERTVAKAYGVYNYLSWDSINIARPSFFYLNEGHIIRYKYIGNHQWDRPDMAEIKRLIP